MTMLASIPAPPITDLHLGPLRVTLFGIVVALALLAGITVTRRRYQAAGGDPELVDRILLPALLLGFVGARAGYVLTHTGRFAGRWRDVLAIWHGGLVLFGGLTVGILTALWLIRRHGADLGGFAGAAAIGIPLAQALGRPADYFSQELFGTPSSLPWAVEIPERLRPAAYLDATTFHPAFLYEALRIAGHPPSPARRDPRVGNVARRCRQRLAGADMPCLADQGHLRGRPGGRREASTCADIVAPSRSRGHRTRQFSAYPTPRGVG
ncbi:MAG TPA: prolipoprotein diacylglyceryl transferase [Nitriliruptorales bacterium]